MCGRHSAPVAPPRPPSPLPRSPPPPDAPVDGDASTDFERSTLLDLPGGGFVVRRVKVLARDPLLAGHVDSTVVARR